MARVFASASNQYLAASAPVTAQPVTMACWAKVPDVTNNFPLVSLSDNAGFLNYYWLRASGVTSGDPVDLLVGQGGAPATSPASGFTANTWFHAAGVSASSTSHLAYLNGTAGTEVTTSRTPAGINEWAVGCNYGISRAYSNATVAEVAIWNVALSAAEIQSLASGVIPPMVRPGSLVAYHPLGGYHGEKDDDFRTGAYDMTAYNTPTWADSPPMIYPGLPVIVAGGGAAPVATRPDLSLLLGVS